MTINVLAKLNRQSIYAYVSNIPVHAIISILEPVHKTGLISLTCNVFVHITPVCFHREINAPDNLSIFITGIICSRYYPYKKNRDLCCLRHTYDCYDHWSGHFNLQMGNQISPGVSETIENRNLGQWIWEFRTSQPYTLRDTYSTVRTTPPSTDSMKNISLTINIFDDL